VHSALYNFPISIYLWCLSGVAKKPVILLLFTAGPVNVSDAKNNANVGAILLCFYPGQSAGDALLRVLAVGHNGTVVSPAARLPYTWPASLVQVNCFQLTILMVALMLQC